MTSPFAPPPPEATTAVRLAALHGPQPGQAPRPHPRAVLAREEVMDALWPDLDPAAAANTLRVALHTPRSPAGTAPSH